MFDAHSVVRIDLFTTSQNVNPGEFSGTNEKINQYFYIQSFSPSDKVAILFFIVS